MKRMIALTGVFLLLVVVLIAGPSTDVHITYVNNSMNPDRPTIFVFAKNLVPTFDVLVDGVAWTTMPDVGKGSTHTFVFPKETMVHASIGAMSKTKKLSVLAGKRYGIKKDVTGYSIVHDGSSSQVDAVEVYSLVDIPEGVMVELTKGGKVIMRKKIKVGEKAHFVWKPKLYWGVAPGIQEGANLGSAVSNTDSFFEQDIEGVSNACVTLTGNPKDGYQFVVENTCE
jgi:hypothetical protein